MKIRISKCKKPSFWYSDKIGEEYTVIRALTYPTGGRGFEVNGKKYIDLEDAEIIFEQF